MARSWPNTKDQAPYLAIRRCNTRKRRLAGYTFTQCNIYPITSSGHRPKPRQWLFLSVPRWGEGGCYWGRIQLLRI